ncbi:succinate dehydrogenase [Nocardia nova]|uniref:Succinate dehydrogenase n=1 Tax=Nocardia nova TaxID=37330 RepID=A0A2S6APN5_9NOCA|nr:FAD-binding protein [Nocardia nova]PPJ27861.1 succinate dehydrogenase [Nocardia nova]PPJ37188.1 succinate dehydrogenase [Nocardia nova]
MSEREAQTRPEQVYDVVIVGFGGAGACAAIAAADAGASVLVLDRFYGGGSTTHSGGVVYAGGGTSAQREAGVTDSGEDMFGYLAQEVGDAVGTETLRRFVDGSPAMIEWLTAQGMTFEGSLCPYKTSYPTNRHFLYYSGNEQVPKNAENAAPAPRGHRVRMKNFSGAAFYAALRDAALGKGVEFRPLAEVRELIVADGAVVGVEFDAPDPGVFGRWHKIRTEIAAKAEVWHPPLGDRLMAKVVSAQRKRSTRHRVLARGGVVLCTGGFGQNKELVRRYAPAWTELSPLAAGGDDGAALRLGAQVHAATSHLHKMSGWKFISPPSGFLEGVAVGLSGDRFANEQLYGATMSEPLVERQGGRGFLILDAAGWRKARRQARSQCAFFQVPQSMYIFSPFGHRRAATVAGLASACGVDPAGLEATIAQYNQDITAGQPDQFGKADEYRRVLDRGPYFAVNLAPQVSPAYPFPFITLGGLAVDEDTGAVRRASGGIVPGLYAAGRAAVGICSNSYVSGLSLADAVFSGRRAGEHAAASGRDVEILESKNQEIR